MLYGVEFLQKKISHAYHNNNSLFEYKHDFDLVFQTRTNASTDRAMCSLTAQTHWVASLAHVFQDTSAMDFTVKVLSKLL